MAAPKQRPRFWSRRRRKARHAKVLHIEFECTPCADSTFYADGTHLSGAGMRAFCEELKELAKVGASKKPVVKYKVT